MSSALDSQTALGTKAQMRKECVCVCVSVSWPGNWQTLRTLPGLCCKHFNQGYSDGVSSFVLVQPAGGQGRLAIEDLSSLLLLHLILRVFLLLCQLLHSIGFDS